MHTTLTSTLRPMHDKDSMTRRECPKNRLLSAPAALLTVATVAKQHRLHRLRSAPSIGDTPTCSKRTTPYKDKKRLQGQLKLQLSFNFLDLDRICQMPAELCPVPLSLFHCNTERQMREKLSKPTLQAHLGRLVQHAALVVRRDAENPHVQQVCQLDVC